MKKFLTCLLVLVLALGCTAYADESTATITATGSGVVMVEADVATISIGVTEQDADVITTQNAVNQKIAAIRVALVDAGVDNADINTDSLYIYANYDYSEDTQTVVGYNATNSLSVRTTEMDKVGLLIDAAFAAGANQLHGVEFSKQDSSEAQTQALTIATQNAMKKAETIASAAGLKLLSIRTITEGDSYSYDSGLNVHYAYSDAAAEYSTDVQAALINVSASVVIEYVIGY